MLKNPYVFWVVIMAVVWSACAGPKKPEISPQQLAQFNLRIREADALLGRADYLGMRQAYQIYFELLSFPAFRQKTGEKYLHTTLLLALRERELGILNSDIIPQARAVIAQNPQLQGFNRYLDTVSRIPVKTKGITGGGIGVDSEGNEYFEWVKQNVEPINTHLQENASSSELFAYLYIAFHEAYGHRFEEQDDMASLKDIYPISPLIRFKLSIYPNLDPLSLTGLLSDNPELYEAELFLGDLELSQGLVLSAEKRYLKAYAYIPISTSIVISLANVCFHLEEFDRCLEYNDRALELAPEYRDAILGKAMSLGYLGRHEEALRELQKLMDLGKYYIGETYYWTAWNLNEMGRPEEAGVNVEQAKNYLIGHQEVMSLSGLVAYQQNRLDQAEQDLTEALKLNPNECESAFYLGKVHSDRKEWAESGQFFERAAICNQRTEAALNERIKEIERSGMSEARKEKHIRKKKSQLLQTIRTKATAYYNAAAGLFNANILERALLMAEKAAEHSITREKAQDLITAIKQRDSEARR